MKFTRDICRLLGLGDDEARHEEMEVQDGTPDRMERTKKQSSSQAILNNEEGLDEDERTRRRAERRRAKRKRQKQRKKLESKEGTWDASEQEEEGAGVWSESDGEEALKGEEQWTAVHSGYKCNPESVSTLLPTEYNRQLPHRMSEEPPKIQGWSKSCQFNNFANNITELQGLENRATQIWRENKENEEPEWDISSAFVANAANNIKLKGLKNRGTQISKENKENEARSSQMESREEMRRRGESLTVQGIQMFKRGRYRQAVDMFTAAIYCDPNDHRFYGNRSYCYWCLEQYLSALTDAQRSIQLAPGWPKGHFRKGCALMALKRYSEAEKTMEQVLKLDQHCKEASSKLFTCRVLQLKETGFEEEQSRLLLEKYITVQAVIASPEARTLKHTSHQDQSGSCRSLWVGNITVEVAEKDLWDLFKMFGEIESVRVLQERFCAFINFKNANMAAKALEKLQGVELRGSKLLMRYPDRWIQRTLPSMQRTNTSFGFSAVRAQPSSAASGSTQGAPINGDECFYWRTTGCFHGVKCHFKHTPNQHGRDKKPWQP